ncbi:riboflavin biosynthesis protein RibF [Akkermansiaceae bacterium]|nr:riboflavin biosynthesis protein RibF [Akkermansiaceae bacterium]
MNVYRSLQEVADAEAHLGSFGLALGVFDGFHLGHQAVIGAARGAGRVGVLTFDPHPAEVFSPGNSPRRILGSIDHQIKVLEELGLDFLVVLEFTREFAAIPAEEFAQLLIATGVQRLAAGYDWNFGKGRTGNVDRLKKWAGDITVEKVEAILLGGEPISSTRIRDALASGDLERAAQFLGRPYSIYGEVRQGRQLGRQLGFPTANVAAEETFLPANGVYAIQGKWNNESNERIPGVANVGTRPTVDDSMKRSLEVHLFSNAVPDCYGWELEVGFLSKIREETKFNGVDDLKAQIAQDIETARGITKA